MGAEDNGLTLEELAVRLETQARRLETLERENGRMSSQNAELRHKVATLEATLEGSGGASHRTEEPVREPSLPAEEEGRMSRRRLLGRAGAAAAGLVVAGALTQRDIREARAAEPLVNHINTANRGAIEGVNDSGGGFGLLGQSAGIGVYGASSGSPGVRGRSTKWYGVVGSGIIGVVGGSDTSGNPGVLGKNATGTGVRGVGETGVVGEGKNGVYGESSTPGEWAAVVGRNTAQGVGVHGESLTGYGVRGVGTVGVHGRSSQANWSSVWGEHSGAGYGVSGTANGPSTAGVLGRNPSGYGGQFEGGKAQLMLKPGGSAGKPTTGTHTKGEIYMDKAGALFVCTAGDGTTVGTWKKVNMKLV